MADHRHKRDAKARRTPRRILLAGSLAVVATSTVVAVGVATSPQVAVPAVSARDDASVMPATSFASERREAISRAGTRFQPAPTRVQRMLSTDMTRRAVREADVRRWTTVALNVWTEPGEKARKVGLLNDRTRVLVTGRALWGRQEVVLDGRSRWVTDGYLVAKKPDVEPEPPDDVRPVLGGACSNGTSVPSGVSPNIVAVHAAVCAAFPEITTYGTLRGDGEHAQGIAVDIMVSGSRGWQVAEFVRENYSELGVSYAIHARNIWSVQRSSEGWRGMEDRGSVTANHYDHVHVTTY